MSGRKFFICSISPPLTAVVLLIGLISSTAGSTMPLPMPTEQNISSNSEIITGSIVASTPLSPSNSIFYTIILTNQSDSAVEVTLSDSIASEMAQQTQIDSSIELTVPQTATLPLPEGWPLFAEVIKQWPTQAYSMTWPVQEALQPSQNLIVFYILFLADTVDPGSDVSNEFTIGYKNLADTSITGTLKIPTQAMVPAQNSEPEDEEDITVYLPVWSNLLNLPLIPNAGFEEGTNGWTSANTRNLELVVPAADLPSSVIPRDGSGYVAWLGGTPTSTFSLKMTDTVTIPQRFDQVYICYDERIGSVEATCGPDILEVRINNTVAYSNTLCNEKDLNQWVTRPITYSVPVTRELLLEFFVELDGDQNSNYFIDNVRLEEQLCQ